MCLSAAERTRDLNLPAISAISAISPPAAAPQQHPQCLRLLCRHCRKLAPVYASLAAKLADDADIVIAQIDGEANDVPGMVPEGFPTIIFFPKARGTMHTSRSCASPLHPSD